MRLGYCKGKGVKPVVSEASEQSWLPAFSVVASGFVAAIGVIILLGWVFQLRPLILVLPTTIAMNPVTAGLFILLGIALWARGASPRPEHRARRTWGLVLAGMIAVVGALKLTDYLLGLSFHIDQFLFSARLNLPGPYPSEMPPNTALELLLCGLALLLFDFQSPRGLCPAQGLVLVMGLIALLALVGYTYRMLSFYQVGTEMPMSLDAASGFAVFCLGFLAARPERGVMSLITSPTTGGAMARRLLPMAIVVPWVLGALLLMGQQAGYYEPGSELSLFAIASIVIFTTLLWWNAKLLYRADVERTKTERRVTVQHDVTRVLAQSANLKEAAPRILQTVCQTLHWPMGDLWMVDEAANLIRCLQTWHQDSQGLEQFAQASCQRALPLGVGVPGRVWALGQPVLSAEPVSGETCPRADVAGSAGLRAAFGFPIRLGGEIFGVMEFFSREAERPDGVLAELLSGVGSQVGQFIERTRAEEQLRQTSANLQRSNTELQQFAYVASHDLTEPLRMVASYLQLVADRSGPGLDAEAREFIGYAVDGAKRMQALIQDLLAYSRVDLRGRSLEPTDAEQVFRTAVANLKVAIEESGALIEHQPLPRVLADSIQLTQVFQNLLGNAIKFRRAAAPQIEVRVEQRGEEWLFSVQDNGIGIDPKDFGRLFVIFQRLHTRQEYAGTGMGLAICKKILERHGGRIWVESAPGKGTTFFFTLPVMKEG